MFDNLLAFLRNPTGYETPLPEADASHAMGALMVRAAKADNAYLFEEIRLIDQVEIPGRLRKTRKRNA